MEKYEQVSVGDDGIHLMRNKATKELVAVKLLPRGTEIDDFVSGEIISHRSLRHPNALRLIEVVLTPNNLAIVMEHAAGGKLFDCFADNGRFSENEARWFFQHLISVVRYCHHLGICNEDLLLHDIKLDGSPKPQVKICELAYTQKMGWRRKTKEQMLAYLAPERASLRPYLTERPLFESETRLHQVIVDHDRAVLDSKSSFGVRASKNVIETYEVSQEKRVLLQNEEYAYDSAKRALKEQIATTAAADVWSCGVVLYYLLVGSYPFEDPDDPQNPQKVKERIMAVKFNIPDHIYISNECKELMSLIFVYDPKKRITIREIVKHPWFQKNLPKELSDAKQASYYIKDMSEPPGAVHTKQEIRAIVKAAKIQG